MSRHRTLPGVLLAAALGLVVSALAAPPAQAAPVPLVQGVAVDGKGKPLLDVQVVAFDQDGTKVATALSYENTDAQGDPQPGYFALLVGGKGVYEVKLKKDGFVPITFSGIEIKRGHWVESLGEVALQRTTTTTVRSLGDVRVGEKGKVKVTVDPADARPTGKVKVFSGRKVVGEESLSRDDKGVVTVTLDKLAKGSYELKAGYAGNAVLAGSDSKAVTFTVKPAKKKEQRPNARAWVA